MALFEKHVHVHVTVPLLNDVLNLLQGQAKQIQIIMTSLQEFKDLLARIEAATNNVAADLKALADKVAAGGLTEAEETEISEALKLAAEKLEGVAAINPETE